MLGGDRRGGGGTRGPAAGRRAAAQTLQQDRAAQGVGPGAWRDVRAKQTLASRLAGLRALPAALLSRAVPSCPPPPTQDFLAFFLFFSFLSTPQSAFSPLLCYSFSFLFFFSSFELFFLSWQNT